MDSNPNSSARIPLREFTIGSIHQFEANRTAKIIFGQATADAKEHTLIIDEIKIDDNAAAAATHAQTLPAPQSISTKGYERHIDIAWNAVSAPDLRRYVIYRSMDGRDFEPIGIQVPGVNRYTDYVGKPGLTAHYKVATSGRQYQMSTFSAEASATTRTMSDDELLTMLQEACFRYYWEGAHPVAGTTLENIPGDDRIVATGASGFGIMALIVGVERGFITRGQGLDRLTKIVSFLEKAPRYHGVWSHYPLETLVWACGLRTVS